MRDPFAQLNKIVSVFTKTVKKLEGFIAEAKFAIDGAKADIEMMEQKQQAKDSEIQMLTRAAERAEGIIKNIEGLVS